MYVLGIFWCFIYTWHCLRNHASDVCVTLNGTGNSDHVEALRVYLLSVKVHFQIEERIPDWKWQRCNDVDDVYHLTLICFHFVLAADYGPPIDLQLGKHVFLSAGLAIFTRLIAPDYCLRASQFCHF